jgi:alpha-1,6-mannosyltransferase
VPLLDLGKLTRYGIEAAVAYAVAIVVLFALYYAGYLLVRRNRRAAPLPLLLVPPALCGLALVLTYPFTAADIFGYLSQARVWIVHGANPFLVAPGAFSSDPFLPFTAWTDEPSTYGPAWMLLSAPAAALGGDDLLRGLLAFKAQALIFLALDLALIWAILGRWWPEGRALGVYLVAWNPLVLLDVAANGHNDVAMVLFVLIAVYALVRRWHEVVLPALTLGALVKFTPIIYVPLALVCLGVQLYYRPDRARRTGTLLLSLAVSAILVVVLYLPFWDGPASIGFLRRGELFTASLGNLLRLAAEPALGEGAAATVAKTAGYAAFAVAYGLCLWRARTGVGGMLTAAYWATLAFIALATMWFQSWYVLWLLPLAALLAARPDQDRAILLTFGALASYEVFIYVWVMNWYTIAVPAVQILATGLILGPLAVYSVAVWLGRLRRAPGSMGPPGAR